MLLAFRQRFSKGSNSRKVRPYSGGLLFLTALLYFSSLLSLFSLPKIYLSHHSLILDNNAQHSSSVSKQTVPVALNCIFFTFSYIQYLHPQQSTSHLILFAFSYAFSHEGIFWPPLFTKSSPSSLRISSHLRLKLSLEK